MIGGCTQTADEGSGPPTDDQGKGLTPPEDGIANDTQMNETTAQQGTRFKIAVDHDHTQAPENKVLDVPPGAGVTVIKLGFRPLTTAGPAAACEGNGALVVLKTPSGNESRRLEADTGPALPDGWCNWTSGGVKSPVAGRWTAEFSGTAAVRGIVEMSAD